MEKKVAGVLHNSRSHRTDIVLNTGSALRFGSLIDGQKLARGRWKLIEGDLFVGWDRGLEFLSGNALAGVAISWQLPNLPFILGRDSLPWSSENMKPVIARIKKTNVGLWSRLVSTRDLPTIAFFRAGPLLRRNGPVPGILAAARPGAIMDKSGRHFVATN
jgi:hypothetical protein